MADPAHRDHVRSGFHRPERRRVLNRVDTGAAHLRRAVIPCRDCRRPLNGSRRKALERRETPRSHWRCVACEWTFLTRLDAGRYATAIAKMISRENATFPQAEVENEG